MSTFFGIAFLLSSVFGTTNVPYKVHSTKAAYDVYVGGKYVGSDPDVRVRREIARDAY